MLLFIFVQMYTWGQPGLSNMNDSVTSFFIIRKTHCSTLCFAHGIFGGCLLGMTIGILIGSVF